MGEVPAVPIACRSEWLLRVECPVGLGVVPALPIACRLEWLLRVECPVGLGGVPVQPTGCRSECLVVGSFVGSWLAVCQHGLQQASLPSLCRGTVLALASLGSLLLL